MQFVRSTATHREQLEQILQTQCRAVRPADISGQRLHSFRRLRIAVRHQARTVCIIFHDGFFQVEVATMESGRVPGWRSSPTGASSTHSPKVGKEQLCSVFANFVSTPNPLRSEKKSQGAICRYAGGALSPPFGSKAVRPFLQAKRRRSRRFGSRLVRLQSMALSFVMLRLQARSTRWLSLRNLSRIYCRWSATKPWQRWRREWRRLT